MRRPVIHHIHDGHADRQPPNSIGIWQPPASAGARFHTLLTHEHPAITQAASLRDVRPRHPSARPGQGRRPRPRRKNSAPRDSSIKPQTTRCSRSLRSMGNGVCAAGHFLRGSSQQPPIDADELTSSARETKDRDALRFIEARAE